MLITFPDRIKEVHVIQNDEIENIQNPTFRLQYAPDPYIKIQTVGTTASIVELHVYALRRPDYAPENKEQLQNIVEGNGLYRSAQFDFVKIS